MYTSIFNRFRRVVLAIDVYLGHLKIMLLLFLLVINDDDDNDDDDEVLEDRR